MPYLEVALKAGNTILVEDERSPEEFSSALARDRKIAPIVWKFSIQIRNMRSC